MRRPTVGQKLFVGVIAVFLVFASTFIVYQQAREKQFKIDALNIRLQDFNDRMADATPLDDAVVAVANNDPHDREMLVTTIDH